MKVFLYLNKLDIFKKKFETLRVTVGISKCFHGLGPSQDKQHDSVDILNRITDEVQKVSGIPKAHIFATVLIDRKEFRPVFESTLESVSLGV